MKTTMLLSLLWALALTGVTGAAGAGALLSRPGANELPGRALQSGPLPSGIALLPGYQYEPLQGIDSRVGRIWSDGGLEIRFDIGGLAGNYAGREDTQIWIREQPRNGHRVQVAMTRDRGLVVTFSRPAGAGPGFGGGAGSDLPANFWAETESDEEIADMLLMVLGYTPEL